MAHRDVGAKRLCSVTCLVSSFLPPDGPRRDQRIPAGVISLWYMTRPYNVVASSEDREDWLAWRKKLITASDVHKVLKGGKEYERLLAEKRGEVEAKNLDRVKPVMAGRFGEPAILEMWKHFYGVRAKSTPLLCQSKKYPFLGATPDGYAWCPWEGMAGVVEIKLVTTCVVNKHGVLTSEYTSKAVAKWSNGPPAHYQTQHDTQMFVTGKGFGWIVAAFTLPNIVPFPRQFDSEAKSRYEQTVVPQLEDFARKARLI